MGIITRFVLNDRGIFVDLKDNFLVKWFKWFFSVNAEKPKNSENIKLISLEHERNSKRQIR